MPSEEPVIKSVKLRGHLGAVLCLDHSSSLSSQERPSDTTATLLSGSEDGTCRIWDLRVPCRASLCIKCPGEVLSVAFGPTFQDQQEDGQLSHFSRPYSVYTAVENSVYGYDLRNVNSPIIEEPSVDLSFLEAPDEINQIAFFLPRTPLHVRRGGGGALPIQLAAADDSGTVRVTACLESSSVDRQKRVFSHGTDESPAMVTCLAFCPRGKQTLVSGGTDCRICLWESSKKQSLSSVSIPPTDAAANQVCNPPMVNALNWSPSGRLVAAGLGDGSVAVLQASSSLVLTARLDDAHGGAVACCLFPEWGSYSTAITSHDRLLCTAGNDECVVFWDLGATLCGEKAVNPGDVLHLQSATTMEQQKSEQTGDVDIDQPRTLFAIQHTAKPNWMVSSRGRDPVFPSSVFIADTSHDITAYTIPLQ